MELSLHRGPISADIAMQVPLKAYLHRFGSSLPARPANRNSKRKQIRLRSTLILPLGVRHDGCLPSVGCFYKRFAYYMRKSRTLSTPFSQIFVDACITSCAETAEKHGLSPDEGWLNSRMLLLYSTYR